MSEVAQCAIQKVKKGGMPVKAEISATRCFCSVLCNAFELQVGGRCRRRHAKPRLHRFGEHRVSHFTEYSGTVALRAKKTERLNMNHEGEGLL